MVANISVARYVGSNETMNDMDGISRYLLTSCSCCNLLILRQKCTFGRVACCPLVSHDEYADGTNRRTCGLHTVILCFPLDAASVVNCVNVVCTFGAALWRFRMYTSPCNVHPYSIAKKGTFFHNVDLELTLTFTFELDLAGSNI